MARYIVYQQVPQIAINGEPQKKVEVFRTRWEFIAFLACITSKVVWLRYEKCGENKS